VQSKVVTIKVDVIRGYLDFKIIADKKNLWALIK
jgi:hypothetical protein